MDEQKLSKLLRRYRRLRESKRIFLAPDIPRIKILDAVSQYAFDVNSEASVLLIFDDTFFRNCSSGILVSTTAMYGKGKGSEKFQWNFFSERNFEVDGPLLHMDGRVVMRFRYLQRLAHESILSFARDVRALFLGRPVPNLDRPGPSSLLEAERAAEAAMREGIPGHDTAN
jgi:hypothetical protein